MKLDEYELDYVKYFIQVKGYHQYEVLAEIMDHFILLLEDKREENPTMSFETLVDNVYETSGKAMFKQINRSTRRRITAKFHRLFFSHLMVFLHYKYIGIITLCGLLLYHAQSVFFKLEDLVIAYSISALILYFFMYKFSSATDIGDPKFLCNKIIKRYGFWLLIVAGVVFRVCIKVAINPANIGFNLFYLISTVLILVQGIILFSLVRTARLITEESERMEETYQVLK
ncbi:MAG: hypothetical protein EOO43_10110 [Flavobacterium sp.]|nr:MAG: hypothetical protein EOO43_10110 [Flavobacterium sp.]